MLAGMCLCPAMPGIELKTRVVVFMQRRELSLVSNTGTLACRVLKNSQLVFRGHPSRVRAAREDFLPGADYSKTFILYPSSNAIELNSDFLEKHPGPLTLICPDGHWGQAKKLVQHEPSLHGLLRVKLPMVPPSNYRLRRNPIPGNVCTFEAIAHALSIIEGPEVHREMTQVFDKMVSRLLWMRGKIRADEVIW